MEPQDIRWKQRFANFERAFFKLQEAVEAKELNELERNGLVQRFEFTLELSSHDYDGKKFENAEAQLRAETFPSLLQLYKFFNEQMANKQ